MFYQGLIFFLTLCHIKTKILTKVILQGHELMLNRAYIIFESNKYDLLFIFHDCSALKLKLSSNHLCNFPLHRLVRLAIKLQLYRDPIDFFDIGQRGVDSMTEFFQINFKRNMKTGKFLQIPNYLCTTTRNIQVNGDQYDCRSRTSNE